MQLLFTFAATTNRIMRSLNWNGGIIGFTFFFVLSRNQITVMALSFVCFYQVDAEVSRNTGLVYRPLIT